MNDQFRICFVLPDGGARMGSDSPTTTTKVCDVRTFATTPPRRFMIPHGMSAGVVAKSCHVPRTRIERIVREDIGIIADTALRLEKQFGADIEKIASVAA